MQPHQRAREPSADGARPAARAGRRARRRGARVREVIVDLPPHALDLLRRARRASSCVAGRRGALGLLRQHGERRLQAVREIAGLGDRAAARARSRCVEQRIQIVDERLHLGRIAAVDAARRARRARGEPRAQLG